MYQSTIIIGPGDVFELAATGNYIRIDESPVDITIVDRTNGRTSDQTVTLAQGDAAKLIPFTSIALSHQSALAQTVKVLIATDAEKLSSRVSGTVDLAPGARPFYDRNLKTIHVAIGASGVAPAGLIVSPDIYVVPPGRAAFIPYIYIFVRRLTAATTPGLIRQFLHGHSVTGSTTYYICEVDTLDAAVGVKTDLMYPTNLHMLSGDSLEYFREDSSVGGTAEFKMLLQVTEYDA